MHHYGSRRSHRHRRALDRALALVLAVGVSAGALTAVTAAPAAAVWVEPDPVADGSMSEEDFALKRAKETGQPYELVSARTESSDTWAQPAGSWTVKRYGTPIRVLRDGRWVQTDPTLEFTSDGSVAAKATTVSVRFSGGGTMPLLSGVKDGRALSLSWPAALPRPALNANVATYPDVLPDVDLQLKAEVEGFSQLLVVKTAEAARNPALATLKFKLDTVGLTVSADAATGALTAVNPAGQTVFTSPSPLMWDSTTVSSESGTGALAARSLASGPAARAASGASSAAEPAAPSDLFTPQAGARDAHMDTTVAGGSLQITPDQELLTGASTRYPVFIDPSWAWGNRQNWTRAFKKYPTTSYWNSKDDVRVGYEAQTNGLSRSFFQLDTSDIRGSQVQRSTFRIRNTWSWSCQDRPVELWSTGSISQATTWNNQPARGFRLDTVNDAKGWSSACAAGNLEFDATALARQAAAGNWASVNLGLYASNESDTFGWKRFDPKTATLETAYDNPPRTPSGLGTNPATSCANGGLVGNTRVSVYALVDDPDAGNLNAEFQVFPAGSGTPSATASISANRGRVATWSVPDGALPTGDYRWRVRAVDSDGLASGWSETCAFSVDRTRPDRQPVIGSTTFPNGDKGWPSSTGRARTAGTFTFGANGVPDVKEIRWSTDFDPRTRSVAPGGGVSITPPGYGPHYVYAYSVDAAGNRSDLATYLYYATRSQDRDGPGDLNGDGNRDIWSADGEGRLVTYAGQGGGTFSPAGNGGMTFDGAQVTASGDWGQDGYNDLVSLQYVANDKRKKLFVYPNNGQGTVSDNSVELTVACPAKDPDLGCDYGDDWSGDDHWSDAEQIVAPGDMNGDGVPDLLVKQGRQLWAYYGNRAAKTLDNDGGPVLVGNGDWDRFTVIAPGDVNGDSIPDLWLREDTTGDLYRSYGSKGGNGRLDPATWGTAGRVRIGYGITRAEYPTVGSVGDLTGDGLADLWARKADNTVIGWPGITPGEDGHAFGADFAIDGKRARTPVAANEVGNSGDRVRWADFDGDGKLDYLNVADNGNVAAWLNHGGETGGGWQYLGRVATGLTTDRSRVRFADFDGDGKADYLMINPNGSVVVYLNHGGDPGGGWQNLGQVATGITNDPSKVRFADFDGDGRTDYLNFDDGGQVFAHLNRGGDIGGGWQWLGRIATGVTTDRSRVRFADFDGDGKADYQVVWPDGHVDAHLNRGGDPGHGWEPARQVATGATNDHTRVQFGDFTGDGHADYILAGAGNSAEVYAWNGGDTASTHGWIWLGRVATGT
ncbi:FG-GAP-like repeat-containing protein [Streptomyces sp. NPDC048659]|uniref:FG-GAP-like repeat-containing protein n=1 Tax=Streptomyces sp. NPDC048659 TaxID=3155489 RepID=UPI003429609F